MFFNGRQCLICDAPWPEDKLRCKVCGSIAEITFERPLPNADAVDEEKIEATIDRVRAHLTEHENDGPARYTLAMAYINLGLLPEGTAELNRAAQLLPEKTEIAYEAAAMAVKQGDYSDEVLGQIERILTRRPSFTEAIYLKGCVLDNRGKTRQAVRAWQDAYQLDPDYASARITLEGYIRSTKALLKDHQIARSLRQSSLTKKEQTYLDLVNWSGMDRPGELGETSMQILETISPAKAKKMRRMRAAQVQQYEEVEQKRNELAAAMKADVVALSNLCLHAQKARTQMREAARTAQRARSAVDGRRLSIEERAAILDNEIKRYQKQGYRLASRTETTAQLSKQREFSCCLALILVLLVIGIILYLIYYLTAKKESYVFLEVDEYGTVNRSYS